MSKPIRVLHVLGILNQGGAENMIMNLYRKIDRSKVQFDFVVHTLGQGIFDSEVESLGGIIYHAPRYKGVNYFTYVGWWEIFFSNHLEYRILHSHIRSCASLYIPIAKRYGLKTIIHSHSTSNGQGVASIVKKLLQFPLRYQADYLFACSTEAGLWLYGKKAVEKEKFKVICNGIDIDRFHFNAADRIQIRQAYGLEDNNFVIGNVGRHTIPKNPLVLLEIFAEIYRHDSRARLLQIGQGEMTNQMIEKCQELSIQDAVIFAGIHNDIEKYYSAMDVFLFPSLWEGLGIVAVEAQTNGLHTFVSEKVPMLADIGAGLYHIIDLNLSVTHWANEIIGYTGVLHMENAKEYARKRGYDVNETAKTLMRIYDVL